MSSKEKKVSNSISQCVVEYYLSQRMTMREIGGLMNLSESYISRVSKGTRNFTLEHLSRLEKKSGTPLPQLLVNAISPEYVPPKLRKFYKSFQGLMETLSA